MFSGRQFRGKNSSVRWETVQRKEQQGVQWEAVHRKEHLDVQWEVVQRKDQLDVQKVAQRNEQLNVWMFTQGSAANINFFYKKSLDFVYDKLPTTTNTEPNLLFTQDIIYVGGFPYLCIADKKELSPKMGEDYI